MCHTSRVSDVQRWREEKGWGSVQVGAKGKILRQLLEMSACQSFKETLLLLHSPIPKNLYGLCGHKAT